MAAFVTYLKSIHVLNHLIQNQVDCILFEEGNFSPLNWLLKEGHLNYNDYLNWRKGSSKYLEDHFKIPIATIITALEKAQDYATEQKLISFTQSYSSATTNLPLHFCRSSTHDLIFTTIYEPAPDRIQMDLFFDSASACAVSDLIRAIIDQRRADIPGLLKKLEILSPDKYLKFRQLLDLEATIKQPLITIDNKIVLLLRTISSLAFEIMGQYTRDFLTPLWQQLSVEIADQSFNAERPENHLSFTAFKGFQWQKVLLSITSEKNWVQQPLLIFRYAESCFKLNKEEEGIANWFRLFILFPEIAEQLIKDTCYHLMYSNWQYFSELDPELESSLFPAWTMMIKPALAKNTIISEINCCESLQLIENLICNAEKEIHETTIHLRTKLKHCSPALFIHYMRTA